MKKFRPDYTALAIAWGLFLAIVFLVNYFAK